MAAEGYTNGASATADKVQEYDVVVVGAVLYVFSTLYLLMKLGLWVHVFESGSLDRVPMDDPLALLLTDHASC